MAIKGIDVSRHQGTIDWAKVKADGIDFAFIKATQGVGYKYTDYFTNNAPLALGNGINVGAYHYGTFSTVPEAITEARYFVGVIQPFKLTYPLVLDLEENKQNVSKAQLTDAAIAFLEYLENSGYFAMIYSGKNFLETQLDDSRLTPYAHWIARYGAELGRNTDIWQYASDSHVNGINGNVDMNWSYRDFAAEITGINQPKSQPSQQTVEPKPMGTVTVVTDHLNLRQGPDTNSPVIRQLNTGEQYVYWAVQNGWYNLGNSWAYGNNGAYLHEGAVSVAPPPPQPVYYVIKSGDNLSKIAKNYGTTVNQITAWNGIKNPNIIKVGQKIRVK